MKRLSTHTHTHTHDDEAGLLRGRLSRSRAIALGIPGTSLLGALLLPGVALADDAATTTSLPDPTTTTIPTTTTAPDGLPLQPLAAASGFEWHSKQRGAGANQPVFITDSGGNGFRIMSISFEQDTYRDVGIWGVGTKTIRSTGKSVIHEWSGTAFGPRSSSITDSNTCTAPGITGLEVGLPSGFTVTSGIGSATQEAPIALGETLHFDRNYTETFQCRVGSAVPAKTTRWSTGEMGWKHGSLRNTAWPEGGPFWW